MPAAALASLAGPATGTAVLIADPAAASDATAAEGEPAARGAAVGGCLGQALVRGDAAQGGGVGAEARRGPAGARGNYQMMS